MHIYVWGDSFYMLRVDLAQYPPYVHILIYYYIINSSTVNLIHIYIIIYNKYLQLLILYFSINSLYFFYRFFTSKLVSKFYGPSDKKNNLTGSEPY